MGIQPTPTQAELDAIMSGNHPGDLEHDGSPPDPNAPPWHLEEGGGGGTDPGPPSTVPVIDSVSPTSGPLPDAVITVTGQNFTDNSVIFCGIQRTTTRSGNQLTATISAQEAGSVTLFVHDDTGDSNTKQFTFTAARRASPAPRPPAGE